MWLQCGENGQSLAWETAESVWNKYTEREWPNVSLGLIRGAAAIPFEDYSKDSERLRILVSVTIWAIWKSRNKNSINDQEVAAVEARETLKALISDLVRKSWNATRFMEGGRRLVRHRELRTLWADKRFADFDLKTGSTVDFT